MTVWLLNKLVSVTPRGLVIPALGTFPITGGSGASLRRLRSINWIVCTGGRVEVNPRNISVEWLNRVMATLTYLGLDGRPALARSFLKNCLKVT